MSCVLTIGGAVRNLGGYEEIRRADAKFQIWDPTPFDPNVRNHELGLGLAPSRRRREIVRNVRIHNRALT